MELKELLTDVNALAGWPGLKGQFITFKRRRNRPITQVSLQSLISMGTQATENQLELNENIISAVTSVWTGAALLHNEHGPGHILQVGDTSGWEETQEGRASLNPGKIMPVLGGLDLQACLILFCFKLGQHLYNSRLPSGGCLELRALPDPHHNQFRLSGIELGNTSLLNVAHLYT